jgi:hypothetical protein
MPTYQSSVNGAVRVSADLLGYPWIEVEGEPPAPVEEQTEFTKQTADAILYEVGNDADLAQIALDEEEASETPRTSLVAKLERIIRNAES